MGVSEHQENLTETMSPSQLGTFKNQYKIVFVEKKLHSQRNFKLPGISLKKVLLATWALRDG